MKTILLFLFGILPLLGFSQVMDDFSDGNFKENPIWLGDTTQFEVNSLKQMHLKSLGADTSALMTRDSLFHETEWDFWIKLSFNTSANNNVRIYLLSEVSDLKVPLNGYYIQVGGANDSLSLVRQTGTTHQTLIHAQNVFTGNSTNTMRIKITLDSTGTWHLYADQSGGTNFSDEGMYYGEKLNGKFWFGVFVRYTSSNATKFYFDDLYIGPVIIDTLPPAVRSLRFLNNQQITVNFSENITESSAETKSNYLLGIAGYPKSAILDTLNPAKVTLILPQPVPGGFRDSIFILNIHDLAGNVMSGISIPISYYVEKTFDVLINEIMPDPEPSVGLPVCEYVELFNNTGYPICLDGWELGYGNYSKIFPDVTINPHGFLTLTKGNPLAEFGPTVNLFTSSSTLSNEGTTLILKNKEGHIIHSVTYSPAWYEDPLKTVGGWSLEQIDVRNPCGCRENWKASTNQSGGTPGSANSVVNNNPDTISPVLQRAWFNGENELDLLFSEPMDSTSMVSLNNWNTEPSVGDPDSIKLISPDFSQFRLFFPISFERDTIYRILETSGPMDCSGNNLDTTKICLAGIPDPANPRDIIINEILPDPETNGERFVELFNRSKKIIDMKQLILTSFDSISNVITDSKTISATSFIFFPGEYIVLTKDPFDITNRYTTPGTRYFIQMSSFPTLSDDHGIIVLARENDLQIIDKVIYNSDMQYPLLNTTQGVSLERLSPELSSEDRENWHSAAESCGFATPGYKNSQFQEVVYSESNVSLFPQIFSPDNDGKDDVLNIVFNLDAPGYLANVSVYDSRGCFVKQLIKNRFLSMKDHISWNGINEVQKKACNGIYLVYFELLNPEGKASKFKKITVVVGKL